VARAVSDDVRVTRSRDGRVFIFIPEPIGAKLGLIEGRRMAVNVDGREAALTPTDGPGIRLVFAQRSRGARVAFTLSTLPNGAFVKVGNHLVARSVTPLHKDWQLGDTFQQAKYLSGAVACVRVEYDRVRLERDQGTKRQSDLARAGHGLVSE